LGAWEGLAQERYIGQNIADRIFQYKQMTRHGKVFGFAGWSGSGKTTLLERLIPEFVGRGLRVALIKHAHHDFDIDQPGKDSWRHRQAGASEVLVSSGVRWALMHELRAEPEPNLDAHLARLSPSDLVLVEGFKGEAIPKLEVHRPSVGKPLLYPEDGRIVAIASDCRLEAPLPQFDLNDIPAIAAFILDQ
jgi:molybdopterin-guanine dinucleotide biosynthesis protein B